MEGKAYRLTGGIRTTKGRGWRHEDLGEQGREVGWRGGSPVKCAWGDIYENVSPFVNGEAQWTALELRSGVSRACVRGWRGRGETLRRGCSYKVVGGNLSASLHRKRGHAFQSSPRIQATKRRLRDRAGGVRRPREGVWEGVKEEMVAAAGRHSVCQYVTGAAVLRDTLDGKSPH